VAAKSDDVKYLVREVEAKCGPGTIHYGAVWRLVRRYAQDVVERGIDAMKLNHPNPIGYLTWYCKNCSTPDEKLKNPKLETPSMFDKNE